MESEKVKEIKKALEDNANYEHYDKLGYIDGYKCKTIAYADILTLINELEAENKRLYARIGQILLDIDTVKEMNAMCNIVEQIKQAVKDFAERLRKRIADTMYSREGYVDYDDTMEVIDETLKEYVQ